ncbi:quinone-dependent dihydroorotate dehydrogenase [Aliterella atlantica]|uniref:Dihydroorotate dehydrogenase (quinone) n=1 Tax=Aliterella atlantica CENA595 TaxID=1618023 RepID=A0A0D8ZR39_9CYAN|nr:quinone-dependent dihydroorotate dehydrogenase [Aliterella atlantica]KJH70979.1 diguanylate cyclase [Aliterella atlantica CENA595]
MDIYQSVIRPILFSGLNSDPEWLQQQTISNLSRLDRTNNLAAQGLKSQLQKSLRVSSDLLTQQLWGISFPNPVGLAAGFDKDGVAAGIWANLGFGFAELGTVTLHAQPGNPQPRLFRLLQDKAALNRMGFNNRGAAVMTEALANRFKLAKSSIPIGINLGKSKVTPLEDAPADYLGSFRLLQDWGDYFVVNVSSPNTPGLRSLQDASSLSAILDVLQQENQGRKPILVKIAPDLEWEAIADILSITKTQQIAGIIATNTTISRENLQTQVIAATGKSVSEEAGGISGLPVRERSTEVIRFIYTQTQGQLPIIGVGGIFTAADAWEKVTAGASLIQVYTGWIYEGPFMVRRILDGLQQKLVEQNLTSISQAIGLTVNK